MSISLESLNLEYRSSKETITSSSSITTPQTTVSRKQRSTPFLPAGREASEESSVDLNSSSMQRRGTISRFGRVSYRAGYDSGFDDRSSVSSRWASTSWMGTEKSGSSLMSSSYTHSTDTLHSRTNSSASVRRPYTRAYLQQRTTQSDYTSYSSSSTLNKSFSELGSSYKAKSMDHIKDVIRYGKLQYNRQYASMGQIDQRQDSAEGITESPVEKSRTISRIRIERFFSYLDRTKRKAKREQKDFRRQRDNLSGVSLIGFQVMCPRALTPRPTATHLTPRPMDHKATDSPVTLVEISQNERAMEQFVQYCIKSSFINELLFWLNVEYSMKIDPMSRSFQFRNVNILTKYLDTNTEYHVQIPSKALPKAFFKQLDRKKEISKEVLASAHDYVEKYIDEQVVPLFVKSKYADLLRDKPPFLKQSVCVNLRISGFKKCYEPTEKHYTYELECQIESEKILIYKKFDDFVENHRVLCNKFPKEKFPPLPSRTLLRQESKRNAKKRMRDLSLYLENLLEMPSTVIQSNEMRLFLDFESHVSEQRPGPSSPITSPR